MWRMYASLFWPKATPMRHRFGPKRRSNRDDAEKARWYRNLPVAHPCTKVTHAVHSPPRRGSAKNLVGACFSPVSAALAASSRLTQAWCHDPACTGTRARRITYCRNATHARRRSTSPKTTIAHPSSTIASHLISCRTPMPLTPPRRSHLVSSHIMPRPPSLGGGSAAALSLAGPTLSTVRDPVKPRLTRP